MKRFINSSFESTMTGHVCRVQLPFKKVIRSSGCALATLLRSRNAMFRLGSSTTWQHRHKTFQVEQGHDIATSSNILTVRLHVSACSNNHFECASLMPCVKSQYSAAAKARKREALWIFDQCDYRNCRLKSNVSQAIFDELRSSDPKSAQP